jgi:hypothetical protein
MGLPGSRTYKEISVESVESARLYRHRNGGLYRVIGVSPSPSSARKGGWIEIGVSQYRATDSIKQGEEVVFYRPDDSNTQSDPSRRYIRPVHSFFETGRFIPVVEASGAATEASSGPDTLVSAIERLCGAMSNQLWNDSVRTERAWKEGRGQVDPPHPALAAELDEARAALMETLARYGLGDTSPDRNLSAGLNLATDAEQHNVQGTQAYAEGFAQGEASTIAHLFHIIDHGSEYTEFPESLRPLRDRILQLSVPASSDEPSAEPAPFSPPETISIFPSLDERLRESAENRPVEAD